MPSPDSQDPSQPPTHASVCGEASSCAIAIEPAGDAALLKQATVLAQSLHWPMLETGDDQPELLLLVTARRYELLWAEPAEQRKAASRKKSRKPAKLVTGNGIYADWSSLNIASAAGTSIKQPIAKALGLKAIDQNPPVLVIDATAGWGEDAWVMASLGCHVLMVERSPVIAAMLQDGLNRERPRSPQTVARLHVVHDNATNLLNGLSQGKTLVAQHAKPLEGSIWEKHPTADVIHLDPMFPGEKTSAQRKPMRLLRRLVGEDADAATLWQAAMAAGAKRVVVKRPPHGPVLGGKAEAAITGKASRYDIHMP